MNSYKTWYHKSIDVPPIPMLILKLWIFNTFSVYHYREILRNGKLGSVEELALHEHDLGRFCLELGPFPEITVPYCKNCGELQ